MYRFDYSPNDVVRVKETNRVCDARLLIGKTENASFYCCWFSTTLKPNTPIHRRIGAHQIHYEHSYTQLRLHVMLCIQKSSARMNGQHKRCFSLFGSVATDEQVEKSKHSGFARCAWFVNKRTSHNFHRPIKQETKNFHIFVERNKNKTNSSDWIIKSRVNYYRKLLDLGLPSCFYFWIPTKDYTCAARPKSEC